MTPLQLPSRATDRGFERLYRRHAPDVYRYALAVLRNPDDAEDVTQTTFMNAYRAFRKGERPKVPKNWLIAIAHNVCRQRFRLASRRPNEVEFDEEITAAVPSDDGPSAGDIRRALGHLAFNQRAALVMRELEGRSYVEIASILGLSVGAVETLIFRARRALREQLEEALTCDEAEFTISRQLDGRLPRNGKGRLRAHLRACEDCAAVARSQRAQRSALRGLAGIPLPSSIGSFFGSGGGAGVGAAGLGVAAKVALLGSTAIVTAGVGCEGVHHRVWHHVVAGAHPAEAGRPVSGPVGQPTTKLISDLRPPNRTASRKRAALAHAGKAAQRAAREAASPVARVTREPAKAAPAAKAKAKRKAAVTKHRKHRHHHPALVARRMDDDEGTDDDDRPAAVAPRRTHKPCKPHRRAEPGNDSRVEVKVAVRARHEHRRDEAGRHERHDGEGSRHGERGKRQS